MLQPRKKEWQKMKEQTEKFSPGRYLFYGLYGLLVVALIALTTWGVFRGIYFPEQIAPEHRTSASPPVDSDSP